MADDNGAPRRGDLLVTVGKLVGIMTAVVIVAAFAFRTVVKLEIDDLRLEMVKTYATRGEVMLKVEYEIRQAEIQRQVDSNEAKNQENSRRLEVIERSLIRNGEGGKR